MKPGPMLLVLCEIAGCSSESGEAELAAFTTDGSSRFPDGTLEYRDMWLA